MATAVATKGTMAAGESFKLVGIGLGQAHQIAVTHYSDMFLTYHLKYRWHTEILTFYLTFFL